MAKNIEIIKKVEGETWTKAIDDAFKKAQSKVNIDGFRKGKVPRDVFEKKYGKEALFFDAVDIVLPDVYEEMLNENQDLEIVAQPKVDIKSIDENGVELVFVIVTKPTVKLGKYKDLKVKKEKIEVSEEEINNNLENIRSRYAENVIKDGKAEMGDIVVIDFEGFKDGVAFEGGKSENYSLELGSNSFIPGFEEALVGVSKDDEKEINVTFPEDYHSEDLKGQPVTFKIKVHEVKNIVQREFDEDFFDDLGMEGITNLEELKNMIKENILVQKENQAENIYIDTLLQEASKEVEVEIPEEMIDDEIHRMLHQYEDQLKLQGISLDMYYQFTNSNEDTLKEQMKEEANTRVLYRLMMEAIAKEEKIEINDEEAQEEAERLAQKYEVDKEEFLKLFGGIDMVKYDMQMRKVIDILKGEK